MAGVIAGHPLDTVKVFHRFKQEGNHFAINGKTLF